MRDALQKLRIVEEIRVGEAVQRLESRVSKHFRRFGQYLIGEDKVVTTLQQLLQKPSRACGNSSVRPNKRISVENNPQWMGL